MIRQNNLTIWFFLWKIIIKKIIISLYKEEILNYKGFIYSLFVINGFVFNSFSLNYLANKKFSGFK